MTRFHIPGMPIPQGSKKAIPHSKSGRIILIDDNPALKQWRQTITQIATPHAGTYRAHEPLGIIAHFHLPRPKTVRRDTPTTKPDLDKLTRALLDGITDAGVWVDDGQVISVTATKRYGEPGVSVSIYSLEVPF